MLALLLALATTVAAENQRPIAGRVPLRHRVFLSVGHDEYWSSAMREHVEAARDAGVHLAFLGADACYWQIRFEANARGEADRAILGYKEAAGDRDGDPAQGERLAAEPDRRGGHLLAIGFVFREWIWRRIGRK